MFAPVISADALSLERRNDVMPGVSVPPKLTMPTICPWASSAGPPLSPCSTLPPIWISVAPLPLDLSALTLASLTETVSRSVGSIEVAITGESQDREGILHGDIGRAIERDTGRVGQVYMHDSDIVLVEDTRRDYLPAYR